MTQLTEARNLETVNGPGGAGHRPAQWVLNWADAAAAGAPACGGKGWNLGRLHRYGFPVPAGGVLVAAAHTLFMDGLCQQPALRELAALSAAAAAAGPEAARALAQVQAAILAAELPAEVAEGVAAFLAAAGLAGRPVAVRSSAAAEGGAASFAGIHRSFLNVSGTPQVLAAIRGCYASLWTPQALAYRRRVGLDDSGAAGAVVICAMVGGPEATAGVAFTCAPRTGRRDRVTISAASGSGEAVVSGGVNPEELAVDVVHDRPPDPAAGALQLSLRQAPAGRPATVPGRLRPPGRVRGGTGQPPLE